MSRHFKYFGYLLAGYKVSRKTKKFFLKTKMNKKKLKKRLDAVIIERDEKGNLIDISDVFCPKCGCEHTKMTNNMVVWPEVYCIDYCLRCRFVVGKADNSLYRYALEFKENNYVIP